MKSCRFARYLALVVDWPVATPAYTSKTPREKSIDNPEALNA